MITNIRMDLRVKLYCRYKKRKYGRLGDTANPEKRSSALDNQILDEINRDIDKESVHGLHITTTTTHGENPLGSSRSSSAASFKSTSTVTIISRASSSRPRSSSTSPLPTSSPFGKELEWLWDSCVTSANNYLVLSSASN